MNKYVAGEMETTYAAHFLAANEADPMRHPRLTCDEAPEEPPTTTKEKIFKIQCNISSSTNYMHTGIMDVRTSPVDLVSEIPIIWSISES